MKSPYTGKEMSVVKETRSMKFRNEEFEIIFHSYQCNDTGEKFEDEKFSELNYNQVLNQYREKYTIPFPEQIKAIREKYDVSQTLMSEILGFGQNTWNQYENGEVPNTSNGNLIQLIDDPKEFLKLLSLNKTVPAQKKKNIEKQLEQIIQNEKKSEFDSMIPRHFWPISSPSIYTGYRIPSLDKLSAMVFYFAEKMQPWKTKLNKLLFYADFMNFSKTGYSISGATYVAIPLGPVPDYFDAIFNYLERQNVVNVSRIVYNNGGTGEKYQPNDQFKFDSSIFDSNELETLASICEKFDKFTIKKIIEYSHEEPAWIEKKDSNSFIEYSYGFRLN